MNNICSNCGCTEAFAIANARALGLLQELQSGMYTCCQIAAWAEEQRSAWFEAAQGGGRTVESATTPPDSDNGPAVLVAVRLRQPQVPWFRNPDDPSR